MKLNSIEMLPVAISVQRKKHCFESQIWKSHSWATGSSAIHRWQTQSAWWPPTHAFYRIGQGNLALETNSVIPNATSAS